MTGLISRRMISTLSTTAALLCLSLSVAQANLTPTLVSIVPEGSAFRWIYDISLDADQDANPGNFMTIDDFAGFVPGSNLEPAGWTFSSAGLGVTAPLTAPADDPTIPNLTWTRTGAAVFGPDDLGLFSAVSPSAVVKIDNFTGRGTRNSGPLAGSEISNIGDVPTPFKDDVPGGSNTPEPCSLGLLVIGLVALTRRVWRRA